MKLPASILAIVFAFVASTGIAQTGAPVSAATAAQIELGLAASGGISERRDWREYFDDISSGGIVISIEDRRLSYWSPGAERFMEFPIGAPKAEEFERTGRTEVVRKRKNPTWTPTESMKLRDPSLPDFMEAGPRNPLGTRAMYLGWPAYLIHGTNAPSTIGRKVSSGCFRMFPQHVELLYQFVEPGTKVYVY